MTERSAIHLYVDAAARQKFNAGMKRILFAPLLLILATPAWAHGTVEEELRTCAAISYAPARLVCYDELALSIGVATPVSTKDTRRALEAMLRDVEARERCEAAGRDDCGPLSSALTMNAEAVAEMLRELVEVIEAFNAEAALQEDMNAETVQPEPTDAEGGKQNTIEAKDEFRDIPGQIEDTLDDAYGEDERSDMRRLIEGNQ